MADIFDAIITKFSGTSLYTDVSGRIYLDQAPHGIPVFPYVVFFIVTGTQEDVFKDRLDEFLIQFSLFSASPGKSEIATMYADLKTAMDDATLTITGDTLIWMIRKNLTTMVEDMVTPDATSTIKHWAVDYSVMVQH